MNKWLLGFAVCLVAVSAFYLMDRPAESEDAPRSTRVRIATKPMTEQFILGEMLALLIERDTALEAVVTKGIGGGTANIHPAMLKGEFDIYPEYTGTAWKYVLKRTDTPGDARLLDELKTEYGTRFGLIWVGMYGFNNTFGVAVGNKVSGQGVKSVSQLAPLSKDLVFGAEYDFFERDDGYDALCAAYGLTFGKHLDMDIGLKYPALIGGSVDVINVFTTDGRLGSDDVVLLEDDRHFYQTYYCGSVVRLKFLDEHPELRRTLLKMENILSEKEMARLNHEVEENHRDDREVAREFLKSKGLL